MEAAPSTVLILAQSRDWLDTTSDIFTVLSVTVLALAALFAFFVQRARYFREIEPELKLGRVRVSHIPPSLEWDFPLRLSVEYEIQNTSSNLAVVESTKFTLHGSGSSLSWEGDGIPAPQQRSATSKILAAGDICMTFCLTPHL